MGMNYKIEHGQMVRISINGTPIMTGICNNDNKNKTYAPGNNDETLMWKYTIRSMKIALQKISYYLSYSDAFYQNIALALMPIELGIGSGRITTSEVASGLWENAGKSIAQTYDLLAKETGLPWWIDTDLKLYFCENESTIEESPYNLDKDFGTNFEDYRHVNVSGDYSQYASSVEGYGNQYEGMLLEGVQFNYDEHCDLINKTGYYAYASKIVSDNNYFYPPEEHGMDSGSSTGFVVDDYSSPSYQPDIEEGDFVINRSEDTQNFGFVSTITMNSTTSTRFYAYNMKATDDDRIWYNRGFNDVLKKQVNSMSAYPPSLISFDTFTPGFLPRQRVYINLPDVDTEGYFLINQVQISDLENNKFEFTITGEKKNYSNWITKSDKGYVSFFKNF